ncbi:MAG: prepilin-type N-terminal cleavage/methylation domain-containing protein [Elusimicrobiales bacterium]|nr:prepilin-type N-terminal cleavage/methylation domain-containing protein [Elusimicrobiales bacterium]
MARKGFTLIELLVVVLIIGILSAVALPQYTKAVAKSRMTQALTWARNIRDAERVYFMANSAYTQNLDELDISLPGCEKVTGASFRCADGWRVALTDVPSIYVYLPQKYTDNKGAGIEYYFSPSVDRRLCFASASSPKWINICAGYGGTVFAERGNFTYYTIP